MLSREPLQASPAEARDRLLQLADEWDEPLAWLSQLVQQPAGYIPDYAEATNVAYLPEHEQRALARYFLVDARELGAPKPPPRGLDVARPTPGPALVVSVRRSRPKVLIVRTRHG